MSDADDPTESTPTTEPVDAVGDAPADDAAPESVDPTTADPARTVTRKGAAIGMAGALLAGGLIGWLGAAAFNNDDTQPISAFQDGGFGEGQGPGGGGFPGGPGGGFPGAPGGGGFPGGGGMPGGHGPGGDGDGDRPTPPWMDEDGDDRRDEYDDESEDQDEQDQSEDEDHQEDSDDGTQDQSDDA